MYELAARIDPDGYLALARATFAEMALAGITCAGEFHYLHHAPGGRSYEDPNAMGRAVLEAARAAGIRVTLLDTCYLHGGISEEPSGAQVRFFDGSLTVNDPGPGEVVVLLPGTDPLVLDVTWHDGIGGGHERLRFRPGERAGLYGATPAAVLAEAGAMDASFTAVHATHLSEDDIALLGSQRATCCLCPTTERDLADGIGPASELARAGAALATGSDSHAVIDPLEEARAIELDERLASGERGRHAPAELLRAATESGHACLGWPDAGRIESGALADLVTVDLDNVRLAGSDAGDAAAAAVFAATAADVHHVVASGREIIRDGVHVDIDVAAELRSSIEEVWA